MDYDELHLVDDRRHGPPRLFAPPRVTRSGSKNRNALVPPIIAGFKSPGRCPAAKAMECNPAPIQACRGRQGVSSGRSGSGRGGVLMRMKFATTSTVPPCPEDRSTTTLPASGTFPEAAVCQSCLRGSTCHRVTSPTCLRGKNQPLGGVHETRGRTSGCPIALGIAGTTS
jgi:hypothetical protein